MHPLIIAAIARAGTGTVTVSGEPIATISATPFAGVRVASNGIISKIGGTVGSPTYTPVDTATDWIAPPGAAAKRTFHVQATLNAESGGGTKVGSLGSWIEITTNHDWTLERLAGAGSGTSTWDLDVEISDDGGSTTLDTGLFEIDAIIA